MSASDMFAELAALKVEVARARTLRLATPSTAVDPNIHTPERVVAFLAARGWIDAGSGGSSTYWHDRDCQREVLVPLRPLASDYAKRVGILAKDFADWEKTGELEILGEIAGQPGVNWTEVRAAQLLPIIRGEGGDWAGARAASALHRHHGWSCSPERAVQFLQHLEKQGHVVNTRRPRGRTYRLPYGPGGEVEYEWSTGDRETDPESLEPVSEGAARGRWGRPWHALLLRRAVTYGPWVEVPAEKTGAGDE